MTSKLTEALFYLSMKFTRWLALVVDRVQWMLPIFLSLPWLEANCGAIGATTLDEYQKYFEKDKALERRFQTIVVDEPNVEDAVSILRGLKERYESHHKINIKDEAIVASVQLSHRYITDRFLPDKAIDLIDEAAARLRLEMNSMPAELDEVERKIRQLEIEREAMKREDDTTKIEGLNEQIANLEEERNQFKTQWNPNEQLFRGAKGER